MTFPAMSELIPHAGPMVLLDEMVQWAPGHAVCRMSVRDSAPFVARGVLEPASLIEHMAQAVAACLGYEAYQQGGGVRVGMIIGCRHFSSTAPAKVGQNLSIEVKRVRGNDSLSHFDCAVEADTSIAEATLTLYHADDIQPE